MSGHADAIKHDLEIVRSMEEIAGLCLNCAKSEIICNHRLITDAVLLSLSGAQVIELTSATLLGSPLGNEECVSVALEKKVNNLAQNGAQIGTSYSP